jgi:hypothetical protein
MWLLLYTILINGEVQPITQGSYFNTSQECMSRGLLFKNSVEWAAKESNHDIQIQINCKFKTEIR